MVPKSVLTRVDLPSPDSPIKHSSDEYKHDGTIAITFVLTDNHKSELKPLFKSLAMELLG